MLEAKLKQGSVLRKIVDSLKDLINEAKFEFTDSGMSLLSMDSSHVVLVSLMLRSDGFEEYRCDRAIPIGLNMASFAKIVRSAAPDDAITLRADNSGESLTIIIDSAGGERTSEYELKLMDLDVEQVTVPDLEYNVVVRMPSEEFTRVCRDLSIVGDAVLINATKDAVRFNVQGDSGCGSIAIRSNMAVDKKDGGSQGTMIRMIEPASIHVALKFLTQFSKASALSETVNLEFSNDCPIMAKFPIAEYGFLRFFLAPKVDDDEIMN